MNYSHKKIEARSQKKWEEEKLYQAKDFSKKPKFYCLVEFPYPSGAGLHVGHLRSYSALDAVARKKRMQGFNVLFPIGWDGFGLPTENYAIKTGRHPKQVTKENIAIFKRQIKSIGLSFDWCREINTTDPNYYKWTQWIFLQIFKKGLAYQAEIPINWCSKCKIGLANEEVVDNKCERCGAQTTKKMQKQWMLRITKYAERLLEDLKSVDYLDKIRIQQENWIGKSIGAEIDFSGIKVFTTRPDTIFGATFLVVSPDHPIAQSSKNPKVQKYINQSNLGRTKEKTGVFTGEYAINPANKEQIPIWVADYVLMSYGAGAIMAVPDHDERDREFAQKYNLKIKKTKLVDSEEIIKKLGAEKKVNYKLRDWVFSRQHYWGEPIPIVHCENCGEAQEDFLKNTEWLLKNVTQENFETLNQSKAVGRLSEETDKIIAGQGDLVYLNSYVLGKLRGWFRKFSGHGELPLDFYFLLPRVIYAPTAIYQDNRNSSVYHFALLLPRHNFNVVIDIERIQGKNEITTLFIARDKYLKKLKKEYSGGPATSPSCLPDPKNWDGGSGISTLRKNSYKYYKCFDKKSQEKMLYKKISRAVAVPERDLPIRLPDIKKYKPTNTGESPLAKIKNWVNTKCPKCGGLAKRETDTMPNWAGSSWYFLRYCDPKNNKKFADFAKLKYWTPIDIYDGGMEHTTLHLLYSRFWHKFLYDIDVVPTKEPYAKRRSHGVVLAEDGRKMSKSFGNVINPDDVIKKYGADTLRLYEMFMGSFGESIPWSEKSIIGMKRFLDKVYKLKPQKKDNQITHKTIKKITEDIDNLKFNTAIACLMEYVNSKEYDYEILLKLLAPFAPHITEELWPKKTSIHLEAWPKYDEKKIKEQEIDLVIQINGKMRDKIKIKPEMPEKQVLDLIKARPKIKDLKIKKTIFVPGRLVNFVVVNSPR